MAIPAGSRSLRNGKALAMFKKLAFAAVVTWTMIGVSAPSFARPYVLSITPSCIGSVGPAAQAC